MRINKYPFFLWLTEERNDFKLDFQNKIVESEELGKSSLKEVPVYLVFFLRYIPFIILFLISYYPKNLKEVLVFIISLVLANATLYLYKNQIIFKIFVFLLFFTNLVLMFYIEDYVLLLDTGITFYIESLLLSLFLLDLFVFKKYTNWYYLEDFENNIKVDFAKKHSRRLLWFFRPNRGFNISKNFKLRGYFLRIENEDI